MIVYCSECKKYFDDEFRLTYCPHKAFAANDGHNIFTVHEDSYRSKNRPDNDGNIYMPVYPVGGQ